jgi:ubiquinone biosynthesis protein
MADTVKKQRSSARLREIMNVLRRHDIIHGVSPSKLRSILEELGPTYVKLGQIMSMRSDMLPQKYCDELAKLRTDVKPMSYAEVRRIVDEECGHSAFESISEISVGSASIAQVHRAVLKDGRRVVVKVQRPGIQEMMAKDIVLMKRAAGILEAVSGTGNLIDFKAMVEELRIVSQQEMDFLLEAQNCREFERNNQDIVYVTCPQIEEGLTTSKVLVMECMEGVQIDNIDTLGENGYDVHEVGLKLAENYMKQVLDDGFFHADPHPGNIWVNGGKLIWLDMGMMGRLTSRDREVFKTAVKGIVDHDIYAVKTAVLTIGKAKKKLDHAQLYMDIEEFVEKYADLDMVTMNIGSLLAELFELAKKHGISMPANITMLERGLLTFEGTMKLLCPEVSCLKLMTVHIASHAFDQFDWNKELLKTGKTLYQSGQRLLELPVQISDVMKMMAKGQTKINLELTGAEEPMQRLNRMVDKIVICILSAALLIGSSLICTTNMRPKILGIPAIGFLGFVASTVLGVWLLVRMWRKK